MQAQFYRDCQGKRTKEVCVLAHDTLKAYEKREEQYACNGEYRPLGFWKVNGYDTDRIVREARPDDIFSGSPHAPESA